MVEGAKNVTVTLSDGSTFAATNITSDPQTDLAVVKIDASNLPYLHLLNNSLEQLNDLDPVVAVGNALALPGGPTWTTGVVSNLGRSIKRKPAQSSMTLSRLMPPSTPGIAVGRW